MSDLISPKKLSQIFNQTLEDANNFESWPFEPTEARRGIMKRKGCPLEKVPAYGREKGFFKPLNRSMCLTVFTTKGGVLKSTLALNIARTAALHGLRTCVVGLDMQCDLTTALGHEPEEANDDVQLGDLLGQIGQVKGLTHFYNDRLDLNSLLVPIEWEHLQVLPETPELALLNDQLANINRREYWLKEKVVEPLKKDFDLIILDCSPNWNRLTTNALVASDLLVSPLECKINNFRNFKVFRQFLDEFRRDMQLDFDSYFVPTRYSKARKLSMEIFHWYQENIPNCCPYGLKESTQAEEATALNLSILEHCSDKELAEGVTGVLKGIHNKLQNLTQSHFVNSAMHVSPDQTVNRVF